ncbi:MAG: OmpA family protein [Gemmobacter sp.]
MYRRKLILGIAAFFAATVLAVGAAVLAAGAIESRAERHVARALAGAGLSWARVSANGLIVEVSGTAPSEAARFRAMAVAGTVVAPTRITDAMEVTPARALSAPRFSLELLRNDDGVSVIGLVPARWEYGDRFESLREIVGDGDVADMLQTADFAIPGGWGAAVDYALVALRMLPRSKISVSPGLVEISAISDSPQQRQDLEAQLRRAVPDTLDVSIDISAPRPVIAPFTMRFVIDDAGPRFDACSAETDRGRDRILRAARAAGAATQPDCRLGLGAPSPRWPDAAVLAIEALSALGHGTVTISDVDISLIAAETVAQDQFDRIVGDLLNRLPEVFSLKAVLTEPEIRPASDQGPPQFSATLDATGRTEIRGRLVDDRMRDAVEAFAKARFGAESVYVGTRLDEGLPPGWGVRVLAGLSALSELHEGELVVQADRVDLRGRSGSPDARAEITRLLSGQLGQGAAFRVAVAYDPALDPATALPRPADCVRRANEVLAGGEVTFAPGSADLDLTARRALSDLAAVLRDCGTVEMEIGGHTDSQGRAETNMTLSQRRAEAVLRALRDLRVPVGNLVAQGYGASQPIADNATEAGRIANRRIEFRLLQAESDVADSDAAPEAAAADTGGEQPEMVAPPADDAYDSAAPAAITQRPQRRPAERAAP